MLPYGKQDYAFGIAGSSFFAFECSKKRVRQVMNTEHSTLICSGSLGTLLLLSFVFRFRLLLLLTPFDH